jgi:hypothetical protein
MAETKSTVVLPRSLATKAKASVPGSNQDPGSIIPRQDTTLVFETVRQLREIGRKTEAIRTLARIDGIVSSAIFALVQTANSDHSVKAYDSGTHEFSDEGTDLARSVAASMDTLYDYTKGYADKNTLGAVLETGLREVALTAGIAAELVLSKERLPEKINLIPYEQLQWKVKSGGGKFPVQQAAGGEIELNIPTFWVAESHKDANVAYAASMMEGALNTAFYYAEFIEDMRRAVRRSGHARIIVTLDAEKVKAAAPAEVQSDPDKLVNFMEQTRADVTTVIEALEPEDALVTYDTAEVDSISAEGEKMDYKELLAALSGMLATSLKTHPSILGLRLAGSQSLSNTESLVYLKIARAIQRPVEQVMSRALTLAVRLYGADVYVKFRFDPIDLRPESELEAFRVLRQSRVLELLSLGFLTDQEAAEELGTGPRGPNAPELSGTMFKEKSGTGFQNSSDPEPTPNDDPMGRSLQPDTPSKAGGESQ